VSEIKFKSEYLNQYLSMVEDTESPRLFHIWGAIGAIAACLGRRCFFPFGDGVIYPNQYIVMVGTPGTRKSTVLRIAKKQLKASAGINFAPDDTAGQRQGLIKAMLRNSSQQTLYLDGVALDKRDDTFAGMTLEQVSQITDEVAEAQLEIDEADKQHLVATSDEFSRFIGQNNTQMLDFLTSTWDGAEYTYETTTKEITLNRPLLNILGCTTPVMINQSMPAAAGGQGFLSRVILVYGSHKYKSVPRPAEFPHDKVGFVRDVLEEIYNQMHGAFEETPAAEEYSKTLYEHPLEITDSRFGYYHERRYTHLIKLTMAITASRGTMIITPEDYDEAHRLLRATERGMPDALGEFGMNPLAALKQNILEYLRQHGTTPTEELRGVFHRDARMAEFTEAAADLIRLNQVSMRQLPNGQQVLVPKVGLKNTEDDMMRALAQA